MNSYAILGIMMAMVAQVYAQTTFSLRSPDTRIEVKIRAADRIKYDVLYKGRPILQDAHLSMNVDHKNLGVNPKVVGNKQRSNDKVLEPVVRQKFAKIRDNYNESRIEFDGGYAVTFRAYNEGVAYRFETSLPQNEVHIYQEDSVFSFAGNYTVYYPEEESFFSHNERKYLPHPMNQLANRTFAAARMWIGAVRDIPIKIFRYRDLCCQRTPGFWDFDVLLSKDDLPAVIGDLRHPTLPLYFIKRRPAFLAEKALKFQTALLFARARTSHGRLQITGSDTCFQFNHRGAFFLKFAFR